MIYKKIIVEVLQCQIINVAPKCELEKKTTSDETKSGPAHLIKDIDLYSESAKISVFVESVTIRRL
jgi:hypothetical protein